MAVSAQRALDCARAGALIVIEPLGQDASAGDQVGPRREIGPPLRQIRPLADLVVRLASDHLHCLGTHGRRRDGHVLSCGRSRAGDDDVRGRRPWRPRRGCRHASFGPARRRTKQLRPCRDRGHLRGGRRQPVLGRRRRHSDRRDSSRRPAFFRHKRQVAGPLRTDWFPSGRIGMGGRHGDCPPVRARCVPRQAGGEHQHRHNRRSRGTRPRRWSSRTSAIRAPTRGVGRRCPAASQPVHDFHVMPLVHCPPLRRSVTTFLNGSDRPDFRAAMRQTSVVVRCGVGVRRQRRYRPFSPRGASARSVMRGLWRIDRASRRSGKVRRSRLPSEAIARCPEAERRGLSTVSPATVPSGKGPTAAAGACRGGVGCGLGLGRRPAADGPGGLCRLVGCRLAGIVRTGRRSGLCFRRGLLRRAASGPPAWACRRCSWASRHQCLERKFFIRFRLAALVINDRLDLFRFVETLHQPAFRGQIESGRSGRCRP